MNDTVTSAELIGKVVVVMKWDEMPTSCLICPYSYLTKAFCKLTLLEFEDTSWRKRRQDFCPLRIVGRWEDR